MLSSQDSTVMLAGKGDIWNGSPSTFPATPNIVREKLLHEVVPICNAPNQFNLFMDSQGMLSPTSSICSGINLCEALMPIEECIMDEIEVAPKQITQAASSGS